MKRLQLVAQRIDFGLQRSLALDRLLRFWLELRHRRRNAEALNRRMVRARGVRRCGLGAVGFYELGQHVSELRRLARKQDAGPNALNVDDINGIAFVKHGEDRAGGVRFCENWRLRSCCPRRLRKRAASCQHT